MKNVNSIKKDEPMFDVEAYKLSKKEKDICTIARELGQIKFAERANKYDKEAIFPIENYKDLHETKLLAICIPEKDGGLGASFRNYCLAAAEIGRYCGSTALTWNMHVCSTLWTGHLADDLKMPEILHKNHQKQRQKHYDRIVKKGEIYSQPFSEGGSAAAGASPFATTAKPVKNGWIINGKKIFASLSGHASYYGILCTEEALDKKPSQKNTLS